MSEYDKQLQKVKNDKGFIAALDQSGGSTPKALKLYGVEEDEYSNERGDVRPHARRCGPASSRARASPASACSARSCSRTPWTATSTGKPTAELPVGREGRRAVPQGRQGPRRRGRRRAGDEADARPRRAVGTRRRRACSARRCARSSSWPTPRASTRWSNSSSRSAGRSSPPAWCRSSSPRSTSSAEQSQGRGAAEGGDPRKARPVAAATSASC